MTPRNPPARRSNSLRSSLGLGEKLFASSDERHFAVAIEEGLERVELALSEEMSFTDSLADVTSRYLLDAGGKRVRPVLTLLTAQLGSGNNPNIIKTAMAIEITHLASLYHDDVMDEAAMRRGVPTAQAVWGNSVAILTGDLLFARASKLVANLGERVIRLQADTFERLCLGQLNETIGPQHGEDPVDHYLRVLADKTGSLISASAQLGVIFSNGSPTFEQPVREFGEKVGIAFQLVDDVIDIAPSDEESGKTPGTDIRAGVATLPVLYLRRDAETDPAAAALLERLTPQALEGHDSDDAITLLREHPVTQRTIDEARRFAREAIEALDPLPSGTVKKTLIRFANTVVERTN